MFGEAPGAVEEVRRRPFVGPAGDELRNTILRDNLHTKVFLANVLCCRPPHNEAPTEDDATRCLSHVARLLAVLQPRLIVALGRVARDNILPYMIVRGKELAHEGIRHDLATLVTETTLAYFTYHPSYLLRMGGREQAHLHSKTRILMTQYDELRDMIVRITAPPPNPLL